MAKTPFMTRVDRADRQRRVAERYASGVHPRVVAEEFGLSQNYVTVCASLYGMSRPAGRRSQERYMRESAK